MLARFMVPRKPDSCEQQPEIRCIIGVCCEDCWKRKAVGHLWNERGQQDESESNKDDKSNKGENKNEGSARGSNDTA